MLLLCWMGERKRELIVVKTKRKKNIRLDVLTAVSIAWHPSPWCMSMTVCPSAWMTIVTHLPSLIIFVMHPWWSSLGWRHDGRPITHGDDRHLGKILPISIFSLKNQNKCFFFLISCLFLVFLHLIYDFYMIIKS